MADPLDVLTLAEAKQVLRIGTADTARDGDLARVVTALSRKLDEGVGPIVQRAVTDERHDLPSECTIELTHAPASSVTIVRHAGGSATTLAEGTDWVAERWRPDRALLNGLIRLDGPNHYGVPFSGDHLLVSYTAGRSASTAAVDARYKEAAAIFLRNLWRPYENTVAQVGDYDVPFQSFPTFAVPRAAKELLADEWLPQQGFGA